MGFASYFEDITARLSGIEATIDVHNASNTEKIDKNGFFELRKEVLRFMNAAKPYLDKDIDPIKNGELRKLNTDLRAEIQDLQHRVDELTIGKKQIEKKLHEKNEQLTAKDQELTKLKRQLDEQKGLRFDVNAVDQRYSKLLLEVSGQFHHMKEITKSNGWSMDKENVKQLELLIDKCLRSL